MNLRQIFRPQISKAAHLLITANHLPCNHQKRQKTGTFLTSATVQLKASTSCMESTQQKRQTKGHYPQQIPLGCPQKFLLSLAKLTPLVMDIFPFKIIRH